MSADADTVADTECPTCGRNDFASIGGMKRHHLYAHGESIAGVECVCEGCGDSFRTDPHRADDAKYCSSDCMKKRVTLECDGCGEEYSVPRSRKDTSSFCSMECTSRQESIICEGCGEEFQVTPSRAEEAKFCSMKCRKRRATLACGYCGEDYETRRSRVNKSRFCSKECIGKWTGEQSKNQTTVVCESCGDEYTVVASVAERTSYCSKECLSEGYSDKRTVSCEACGDEFQVKRYREEDARFCSHACMGVYLHENRGGDRPNSYYGPNWGRQRRRARDRDQHRCQSCGMTEPKHIARYGHKNPVHHITPIREFRGENGLDHEEANTLSNLITLCDTCHPKWERMAPLRPATDAQPTDN